MILCSKLFLLLTISKNTLLSVNKQGSTFVEIKYYNFAINTNGICPLTETFKKVQKITNTILAKIYQTNCSFSVKQHPTGKVQFLFFKNFFLVLTKF